MNNSKKRSILGLAVFIACIAGINGWFLYKRSTAQELTIDSTSTALGRYQFAEDQFTKKDIKKIQNGNGYTEFLLHDGRLFSAGSHSKGQLGVGAKQIINGYLYQIRFPENVTIADISSVDSHTVALDTTGTVWAWGLNISGQIGNGTHVNQNTPVRVLENARAVTAGYRFSAAAKEDGSLWAWGMTCDKNNPEFDKILQEFAASATAGGSYYGGVDSGDTQDCINEQNLPIASITPRQIPDVTNIAQLSAGYGHLLWLTSDGRLWSWGCNQYAQLGREKTFNSQNSRTPGPVTSVLDRKFSTVSAGFRHSIAIEESGTLWAWGHNASQEASTEPIDTLTEPNEFKTPNTPVTATAGHDSTAILTKEKHLFVVGDNIANRLTPDTKTPVSTFTKISDNIETFVLGRESILYTEKLP